jgi:hypothetical protein
MPFSWSGPLSVFRRLSLTHVLIGVGLLGLYLRLYVVAHSLGSNDIVAWEGFGASISQQGLGRVYDRHELFNHPPLMGLLGAALYQLAEATELRFAVLFKIPELLADFGSAALLFLMWRHRSQRQAALVFALFCWSPVSILVGAYHGNTDSLCATLVLLSTWFIDRRRPLLGGLALAASVNVKLVPIVLIPVLLGSQRGWRELVRFSVGLGLGAIPFLPVLLTHWEGFYAHVLSYRSFAATWGITAILQALATTPRLSELCVELIDFWVQAGTSAILLVNGALGLINWRRRGRWSARELAAAGFGVFMVLAQGWGIQYTVYLVPVLFAAQVERAVTYSLVAGLYVGMAYFVYWTGERPFFSLFPRYHPAGVAVLGFLAWMVAIRTTVDLVRAQHRPPDLAARRSRGRRGTGGRKHERQRSGVPRSQALEQAL